MPTYNEGRDRYCDHRLALSVIDAKLRGKGLERALDDVHARGAADFARFLVWHKLAPTWFHILEESAEVSRIEPVFRQALLEERRRVTAAYLAQQVALTEIDRRFAAAGIIYAAIKGAHIREVAYPDASLRPAADIDILVAPHQSLFAVSALISAGYSLVSNVGNLSHEVSLLRGNVAIDLHWDILRPGRTRNEMVGTLLERRVRVGSIWGLDPSDASFLMLVHPAFTKYVNSPNAALIGVVDFMLLVERLQIDWDLVASRLESAGLKTAAWIVLLWFLMVGRPGSVTLPEGFVEELQPGIARAAYLRRWLKSDLATRWLERPLLVQAGLTMALHDRPADAWRAVRGFMVSRAPLEQG